MYGLDMYGASVRLRLVRTMCGATKKEKKCVPSCMNVSGLVHECGGVES